MLFANLDNTVHICHNEHMSETFTPLQSPYIPHEQSSFSKKQIAGAITTLGLLVAIGGSFFYINNVQTRSTKAFSTDQCVAQGGFEWANSCPPNTTEVGKIDSTSETGTGGIHACCVPNNSLSGASSTTQTGTQSTTQTDTQNTTPGGDGDKTQATPPPGIVTPPTCNAPKPQLTISCPNGCK